MQLQRSARAHCLRLSSGITRAAVFCFAFGYASAFGTGLDALDAFLKGTRSGQAQFNQEVSSPPKTDTQGNTTQKIKKSSGLFAFQRPSYFVFEYKKPSAQTLLADGTTLWSIDYDLGQANRRSQATALASTPVALIATASQRSVLERDFTLQEAAPADGLQWVLATPKGKDNLLTSIKIGLRESPQGVELAELRLIDSFGQQSTMRFTQIQLNIDLDRSLFKAKVPAGLSVSQQ